MGLCGPRSNTLEEREKVVDGVLRDPGAEGAEPFCRSTPWGRNRRTGGLALSHPRACGLRWSHDEMATKKRTTQKSGNAVGRPRKPAGLVAEALGLVADGMTPFEAAAEMARRGRPLAQRTIYNEIERRRQAPAGPADTGLDGKSTGDMAGMVPAVEVEVLLRRLFAALAPFPGAQEAFKRAYRTGEAAS